MAGTAKTDEGPLVGASLALTLYGLAVIVASLFHVELVPHQSGLVALLMVAFVVAGAAVGAAIDGAVRSRR